MWPPGGARSSSRTIPTSVILSLSSGPLDEQKRLVRRLRVLLFIMVSVSVQISENFKNCKNFMFAVNTMTKSNLRGNRFVLSYSWSPSQGGLRGGSLEADTEAEARNTTLTCSPQGFLTCPGWPCALWLETSAWACPQASLVGLDHFPN